MKIKVFIDTHGNFGSIGTGIFGCISTRNVQSAAELCGLISDILYFITLKKYSKLQVDINTSLGSFKESVSNSEDVCNLLTKIWKDLRFQDNDWVEQ